MNSAATTPNPLPASGAREFKTRAAPWIPYIFGGCFGTLGLIALVGGIAGIMMGGGSGAGLPLFIGVVFLAIGVAIPIGIYFLGKTYTISCRPDGFTVRMENKRKGAQQKDYRWDAVTSTQYEEFRARTRKGHHTRISFAVETTQGRAFKVGPEIGDFKDLIKHFNAMTPQLPYTWEPQAGFSVGIGRFSAGGSGYIQTPRSNATPPESSAGPLPPLPLPPA